MYKYERTVILVLIDVSPGGGELNIIEQLLLLVLWNFFFHYHHHFGVEDIKVVKINNNFYILFSYLSEEIY